MNQCIRDVEEISKNGSYVKYFFHRDGNKWHCIVNMYVDNTNNTTYHTTSIKKNQAHYLAKKYIHFRCRFLDSKKNVSNHLTHCSLDTNLLLPLDSLSNQDVTKEQTHQNMLHPIKEMSNEFLSEDSYPPDEYIKNVSADDISFRYTWMDRIQSYVNFLCRKR